MTDPAVLLYTSDFLTGVIDMTMEERGQYITLLCYQHQKGHISLETIRLLVGSVSVNVLKHFVEDENGLFYNKRMEREKENRLKFTESRRNNGKKGGRPKKNEKPIGYPNGKPIGKPKRNLMGNENDNENENINNNNLNNIFNYIESNFGITISGTNYEKINSWLKDYEETILCYAVDKCIEQGKKALSYFYAILENWKTSNFKTMEDIKAHEETLRKLREKRNEKPEELFDYNWLEDGEEKDV